MAWGKVDDRFAFHPKVAQGGTEALGLWVRSLSYSCQQYTDGFVPHAIVSALGGAGVADRLVEVGLWHEADGGFEFNDWAEYQPSGAAEKERRAQISAARSEIGKKGAEARWNGKTDGKPMAKGMANEWQADAPVPVPVPVPDTTSNEVVLTRENPNEKLFEQFWSVWPKRVDKGGARRAWVKAVKKADADVIISAATAYAASPYKPEQQFIPMPATWLNGERWLDDAPTAPHVVTKAQKNLSTVEYFEQVDRLAVEA